ncbi:MAG TPA: Hsp20/alpha crystallin family protein [Candidatus Limnocylindrales bacterium]|nr:Hsp20/alpha crystallin family protein [Candidatus Limnocylindrales bacterium]
MGEPVPVHKGQALEPWHEGRYWEPFREMENMLGRMIRGFPSPSWAGAYLPPVDIEETDDAYIFEVELPGVRRDDITIEVDGQELHIHGQILEKERKGIMRQSTRRSGGFDYRATLPSGLDPDRAEAHFDNGVLTVRIPRSEGKQRRRITIS